ncbi:polymorphic toxin-type HINT domain-containing protein [Streptomyces sp. NPDC126933]|uniref:polymorphic toxin-type HINT domain-containing protein n=1 Tax=unclassified Streptomyces TaxID=2593676 RepID=UPI0036640B94
MGLRRGQSGQTAVEYVGLLAVVIAIVGALVATGIGPTLADGIRTQVCRVAGGSDCGGGNDTEAAGDQGGQGAADPAADTGGTGGTDGAGGEKTQAQLDYEKALKDLQDAQAAEKSDSDKAKEAAKELAKILADELGITDALDCITKGDMGACTETLINVLLSVVGGAVGKLAAKYGAPWKWKKAVQLVKNLKKHGGDLYDGLTGLIKNRKKVKEAEGKLADARKKLDGEKKDPPKKDPAKEEDPKKNPPCTKHSFLPGTPVLLADGSRVPIETVSVGTKVTATDPASGLTATRAVTDTITTYSDRDFTRLQVVVDGRAVPLTATDTHPFWLTGRARWVDAGDIRPGDRLRTPSGASLRVASVFRYTERQTTHDLTVSGIHTYYVGVAAQNALVHNCDEWTSKGNLDEHYEKHGDEMGYESQREYEEAAKDLLCDCDGGRPGVLVKEASEDGSIRYFDPATGEYGMKSKKGIISFYKLDGGLAAFKGMPGTMRPRRRRMRRERE